MASGRLRLPPPQQAYTPTYVQAVNDLLESKLKIAYGLATLTFPGAVPFSNALQVTHGIDVKGSGYGTIQVTANSIATNAAGSPCTFVALPGATTTQIQIQAFTTDGVAPALNDTVQAWWLIIVP